jgi:hypothetical protein
MTDASRIVGILDYPDAHFVACSSALKCMKSRQMPLRSALEGHAPSVAIFGSTTTLKLKQASFLIPAIPTFEVGALSEIHIVIL